MPGSPFGRAVLAALVEKGAPYRLAPVAPGALKSPEHLARHPFGRVPVLEHDGFLLYETQAILRYLDRVLPQPALTPSDPKRAARMDQVMNVNDWYLFHNVANVIVFHRVIGPRVMGLVPDEAAIAAAMPKALTVFNELAHLLGEKPYFAGDSLSLADLMLAPAVEFFAMIPEWSSLGAPHANLMAWLTRMQERPSMTATTWERVSELAKAA
ncbi:MAG: glutathione S-transferase family protein [Alphaproteobacteria bacterium]|nr:MAG: glutathione S-transferase family protein [Alphaproteobacteria bacterium]